MYFNCCCSCSFEREIIKIGQSSHKMYSNNIVNFQESTTILNTCSKKSGNLLKALRILGIDLSDFSVRFDTRLFYSGSSARTNRHSCVVDTKNTLSYWHSCLDAKL